MTAKRLSRIADRVLAEPPTGEWGAFRLSLLVQRNKRAKLESTLKEIAGELASQLSLDWIGPLPPYSFVQPTAAKRAG